MDSRRIRGAALSALALLAPACGDEPRAHTLPDGSTVTLPARPIDLILIVIDTLRADAVLDPEGRYDTPSLDRLAREGLLFTRAFAHAPMTLPSHTALFSSRPPLETNVLNNGQDVPPELPLLAEWLSAAGYRTRAVLSLGTLNLGRQRPGVRRGFEEFDADFWCLSRAEQTAERLRANLERHDPDEPLFLFAHYADPHEPYNAHGTEHRSAELQLDGTLLETLSTADMSMWVHKLELSPGKHVFEFRSKDLFRVRKFDVWEKGKPLEITWGEAKPLDRTKLARAVVQRQGTEPAECQVKVWISDVPSDPSKLVRYAEEVAYADRYVGELLARLDELGLYQESLIVFTSDHGEALGERKMFGHVEGLTDEQIQVPLIIKLPRGDARTELLAQSAERIVPHIDVVPTVLEILGLPPLPGQRGKSLLEPHDSVHLAETHKPEAKKDQFALRDLRYKMIYLVEEERFLMYDLERDPAELEDVFATSGAERPDWPEHLRSLGRARQSGAPSEVDEATRRELEALGYGGGG